MPDKRVAVMTSNNRSSLGRLIRSFNNDVRMIANLLIDGGSPHRFEALTVLLRLKLIESKIIITNPKMVDSTAVKNLHIMKEAFLSYVIRVLEKGLKTPA
ncbi:MAG: hypothetical protein EHM45_12165 [Desulfobacteraceae bacterium]|nr:MAG: hypothetical protein EHM45_12165 [Desulfobacteraceae bacterium]